MIICNDNFCFAEFGNQIAWHELALRVIAVRVVGLQHAQAVANRNAGRHNHKAARKFFARRIAQRIDGLPRNQHCHDRRFPRARCHLERDAFEFGICIMACLFQMLQQIFFAFAQFGRDFGQPDKRLDGFDLTKERANGGKGMLSPMLQQARSLWCDAPITWVRNHAPLVHEIANEVDVAGGVVLLRAGGQSLAFVHDERDLSAVGFVGLAFFRFGDGRNKFRPAAAFDNALGWLTLLIQFPMFGGTFVRRVEDRLSKEKIIHNYVVLLWLTKYPPWSYQNGRQC